MGSDLGRHGRTFQGRCAESDLASAPKTQDSAAGSPRRLPTPLTFRSVYLVAAYRHEVNVHFVDVDGYFADSLGGIRMEEHLAVSADASCEERGGGGQRSGDPGTRLKGQRHISDSTLPTIAQLYPNVVP